MDIVRRLPFIYDIATSDRNWSVALDHISDAAEAKGAVIYASNNTEFLYNIVKTSSYYDDFPAEVQHYLSEFEDYDREVISLLYTLEPFSPYLDTDLWGPDFLERGRDDLTYIQKNFGIYRRVGFNVAYGAGWNAALATHYDQTVRSVQDSLNKNVAFLSTHLGKAIEVNRFFSQLRQKFQAVLTVLDNMDVGLCIALATGEIIVHNHRAEQIFASGNGIKLSRYNALQIDGDKEDSAIKAHIRECSKTASGQSSGRDHAVLVGKRDLGEPYLVEVSPIKDGDDELNEQFAGALVLVIDPDNPPNLSVGQLARLHHLTEAEEQVTSLLLEGYTHPEIASLRQVSAETVRNQTRAIYSKVNARNRAELIKKISSLSPPILRD